MIKTEKPDKGEAKVMTKRPKRREENQRVAFSVLLGQPHEPRAAKCLCQVRKRSRFSELESGRPECVGISGGNPPEWAAGMFRKTQEHL